MELTIAEWKIFEELLAQLSVRNDLVCRVAIEV